MDEVKQLLGEYREYVWQEIAAHLGEVEYPRQFEVDKAYLSEHDRYREMFLDYPNRKGKYIRPTLVLLTAESLGLPREKARKTAAAMQLSEDWILLLDDLMDKSQLRRGKPAFQNLYSPEQGMIVAAALQATTWKILTENIEILGAEIANRIFDEMHKILHRTVEGQAVEWMWISEKRHDLKEKDILFTYDTKTGYYSVSGPIRLGALAAGAKEEILDKLTDFGKELATCFQIVDDILGLGDFDGLKQFGGDVHEGKPTILTADLFKKVSSEDRVELERIYGKEQGKRSNEEVKWVIEKMQAYGVVKAAQELAEEYRSRANKLFDQLVEYLPNKHAVGKMKLLMDFILKRTQ